MSEPNVPELNNCPPPKLAAVVGQTAAVNRLRVAVEAATADSRSLDHLLFVGAGGVGKTMMAQVLAAEMASGFREVLAQTINCDGSLAALLLECDDRDVLFIDEIHMLSVENQTLLYRAMAERKLFVQPSRCQGRSLPLASFTLLGATTDQHELLPPFRDRFLTVSFSFYTATELSLLLNQRATALSWNADDEVIERIAALGRGVPRIALKLLGACRQVCRSEGRTVITPEDFERAVALEGLDTEYGLDRSEQQLLTVLSEASGPVRLNVLASRLGLPVRTVSHVIEVYLIRLGLIDKQPAGRELTAKGLSFVRAQQVTV